MDKIQQDIYPATLKLEKVNQNLHKANVLDLKIKIKNNKATIQTYDKRRDYNFSIINYPHINSNVPIFMCYNIYKGQVLRHARINNNIKTFIKNIKIINKAFMSRGYDINRLKKCFIEICNTTEIKDKYNININ